MADDDRHAEPPTRSCVSGSDATTLSGMLERGRPEVAQSEPADPAGASSMRVPMKSRATSIGRAVAVALAALLGAGMAVFTAPAAFAAADFTVAPTSLTFPDTVRGSTTPMQSVVITNVSSTSQAPNLAGGALFDHTDFASDGQTCGTLAPGASCAFRYHFAPTKTGTLTDGTTIGVDGVNYPITLTGKGITGIDVSPTSLQFPDTPVGQLSSTMDVTLTNVSGTVLHPGIGGGALVTGRNFVYDGENCPGTLAPGQACDATYQFAPKDPGRRADTASLAVAGGTVTISLTGGPSTTTTPATATHRATTPVPSQHSGRTVTQSGSQRATPTLSTGTETDGADAAAGSGGGTSSWLFVWIVIGIIVILGIGLGAYALGRRRR